MVLRTIILTFLMGASGQSFAQTEPPQFMTVDGRLYDSATPEDPLLDNSVLMKIQILNPAKTCILYEEEQTVSTLSSNGYFNVRVGSPTSGAESLKRTTATIDVGNSMMQIFQNQNASIAGKTSGGAGCGYIPAAGDTRYFRFVVTPSTLGVTSTLSPDMQIDSVPQSLVAETLQGMVPSNFVQTNTDVTQAKVNTLFGASYTTLSGLLAGSSSLYLQNTTNGTVIPSRATTPGAPTAGQIWYDSDDFVLRYFDGSVVQTLSSGSADPTKLPLAGGIMAGAIDMATNDITDIGHMTQAAQRTFRFGVYTTVQQATLVATPLVAVHEGTVWYNTTTNKLMFWDGTAEFAVSPVDSVFGRTGAVVAAASDYDANQIDNTPAGAISATEVQAAINELDTEKVAKAGDTMTGALNIDNEQELRLSEADGSGANYVAIKALTTLGANYTLTLPADAGAVNQVLTTNGSGVLSWTSPAAVGETNTASNQGAGGVGFYDAKSGVDLQFRNLNAASNKVSVVLDAANKEVDINVNEANLDSAVIPNTAAGTIAATNVQAAINELDTDKVAKVGDSMSGALTFATQNQARFADNAGGEYAAIQAPTTIGANYVLTLPDTAGTNGQVLSTNGSGVLSWIAIPSAPVTTVFGRSGAVVAAASDYDANQIDNTAAGTIAATDVQGAINELDSEKVAATRAVNTAAGSGLSGGGDLSADRSLSVNINGTTAETVVAGTDEILIYDVSATALRKMTRTNFVLSETEVDAMVSNNGYLTAESDTLATVTGRGASTATNITLNTQAQARFADSAGGEYAAIQAPATIGTNYVLTLPDTAGTNGQVLSTNGSGILSWIAIPSAPVTTVFGRSGAVVAAASDYDANQVDNTPAGAVSATQVQSAINELDSEKVAKAGDTMTGSLNLDNEQELRLSEADGSGANYVAIKALTTLGANYTLTLPADAGAVNQVLTTNGSGVLSWTSPAAVGETNTASNQGVGGVGVYDAKAGVDLQFRNLNAASNKVSVALDAANKEVDINVNEANFDPAVIPNTAAGTIAATNVQAAINELDTDKVASTRAVNTVAGSGLSGGGDLSADRSLSVNINGTTVETAIAGNDEILIYDTSATALRKMTRTNFVLSEAEVDAMVANNGYLSAETDTLASVTSRGASTATSITLNTQAQARFADSAGGEYAAIQAPATIGANYVLTLPDTAGTNGQVLSTNGSGVLSWIAIPSAPVTTVFGRSGAVVAAASDYDANQIDNTAAGAIAATDVQAAINELDTEKVSKAGDTMTGALNLDNEQELRLSEADGSGVNYVAIKALTTLGANYTLTLPANDGDSGQYLQTDGNGILAWVTPAGVGETNTASNQGAGGVGVFKQKTTFDLEFRNINAASNKVSVALDAANNEIDIDVNEANLAITSRSINTAAGSGLSGGGDLSADRSLSVNINGTTAETVAAANDEILIYDTSATALRKMARSDFLTGYLTAEADTLATVTGRGASTATSITLNTQAQARFADSAGGEYAAIQAPATIGTNYILTLPDTAGTNGQVLSTNGSGILSWIAIPSAPVTTVFGRSGVVVAATSDYDAVQIDNTAAGTIAATDVQAAINELDTEKVAKAGDTMTGALNLDNEQELRLSEADGSGANYVAIKALTTLGANYTLTLPADAGAVNQVLTTNGSGVLSWTTPAAVGETNTASNQGVGGVGFYDAKSGVDLQFRNLNAASNKVSVALDAANKEVDINVNEANFALGTIPNTAAGNIAATNAQAAINELDTEKVAKAGDTMTGALTLSAQNQARFADSAGGEYAAIQAPATIGTNYVLTLPDTAGTNGQVLSTNGSGVLSWIAIPSAPVTTVFGRSGAVVAATSDYDAVQIDNTAAGTISATDVQAAINELDTEKVASTRAINTAAGSGLTGGGDLSADSSLSVNINGTTAETVAAANDEILIYDTSATALRKMARSDFLTGYLTAEADTLATVTGRGASTATSITLNTQAQARFADSAGGEYAALQAPATIGTNYVLTLPTTAGTANQVLTTDGSGILTWTSPASAGEVNTASNQGAAGVGLYDVKSGVDLQFRNINAASNKVSVALDAGNKEVDINVNEANFDLGTIPNTAAGNIAATNAQAAINELDTEKVAKAGDTMTGALTLSAQNQARFADSAGGEYAAIQAPTTIGTNYVLTLPDTAGSASQVLTTNGSGVLSWTTPSTTPGADSLDFTHFADAMTLDVSTDIAASGTNVLSITNSGSGDSFRVNDATGDTTPFVIDQSGNVGIGTAAPGRQIHAYSAGSTYLRAERSAQNVGEVGLELFGGTSGTSWSMYQPVSSSDLRFYNSGADRFTIQNSSGNVGIGTTVPGTILDAAGAITSRPLGTGTGQTGQLLMRELAASPGGTDTVAIRAPDSITTSYALTLPDTAGVASQVLTTNGAGILSWTTPSTTPGADSLDFTHFADAMTLDASTDIAVSGTDVLSVTNSGTGNSFRVNDATGDTTPFVVDASGNVGIGTTAPLSLFDISSATGGTEFLSRNDTTVMNNDLLGSLTFYGNDANLSTQNIFGRIAVHASQDVTTDAAAGFMIFSTTTTTAAGSPTEKMRITAFGDVGIGTSAPVAFEGGSSRKLLSIYAGSGSAELNLDSDGSSSGYYSTISLTNNGTRVGYIRSGKSATSAIDGNMAFATHNGTALGERMRITEAGNVGIGTTVPASLFDVSSATGGISTLSRVDTTATAADSIGLLQFWNNDTQLTTQKIYGNIEVQSASTVTTDAAAGNMIFRTTASTVGGSPIERMRIDSAGLIGIGTTTPGTILDAAGAITSRPSGTGTGQTGQVLMRELAASPGGSDTVAIRAPDSITTSYALTLPDTAGTSGQVLRTDGAGILTWINSDASIAADALDFTHFADNMTLDASTNIAASGTNVLSITNSGTGNSFVVNDATGDTSPLVVDASGNVGVGTTVPDSRLDIRSSAVSTTPINVKNSVGFSIFEVQESASSHGTIGVREAGGIVRVRLHSAGDSYMNGGNFGIGLSDPNAELEVKENIRIRSNTGADASISSALDGLELISFSMNNTTNMYGSSIKFSSRDADFTTANPKFLAGIIPRATEAYNGDTKGGMAIDFATTGNAAGASTVPSVRLSIDSGGSVGIGTTIPSTILDIAGALTSRPTGTGTGQTGQVMLRELAASPGGTDTVTIRAPDSVTTSFNLTLPNTAGTTGQVLQTDGAGILSWINAASSVADDSLNFDKLADALALDASTDIGLDGAEILSITNTGTANSFVVNDQAGDTSPFVIDTSGNVGIGTTTAASKLEVNGRIVSSLVSDADALTAVTVDFSAANVIDATGASAACGTLNITNTVSGGSFTVTIPNATATCTTIQWNGSATGVKLPAGYAGGITSAGLVYSFVHSGSLLWVTNVTY